MGAAAFVWYYSNLWLVITTDVRINRFFLYAGVVFLAGVISIITYMAVYVPYIAGVQVTDFNKYCPRVVQAAVLQMLLLWISFNISIWPVYGWISVVIVSVSGVAAILSTSFIPSF